MTLERAEQSAALAARCPVLCTINALAVRTLHALCTMNALAVRTLRSSCALRLCLARRVC